MSDSWDWDIVKEREYWNDPSDESYYYAEKWKREGRKRILDLGCGLGRHSLLFARYGFHVTAIDTSQSAIDHLSGYCSDHNIDIRCDVGDMHSLPYEDGDFDCIFAYLSVSHTDSKGIHRILSEMQRVLVPEGSLFFTLCSKDTWSFTQSCYPRIDDNSIVKTDGPEKGLPHFYVDQDDIKKLMKDFQLVRIRHVDDCFFQGGWRNSKHYFIEALKRM